MFELVKIDMHYLGKEKKNKDSGGKMMLIILEATQIQGHLERGLFLLKDQFPSTWGWNLNKERITVIREQRGASQVDMRQ